MYVRSSRNRLYVHQYQRGGSFKSVFRSISSKLPGIVKAGGRRVVEKLKDPEFRQMVIKKAQPLVDQGVEFAKDKIKESINNKIQNDVVKKELAKVVDRAGDVVHQSTRGDTVEEVRQNMKALPSKLAEHVIPQVVESAKTISHDPDTMTRINNLIYGMGASSSKKKVRRQRGGVVFH